MALRKSTPFIELRLRHKDGRWRVFESAGSYVEVTLPVRAELREIRRASSSAASLTRQLLVFSRRMPAVLQPMDLNRVISELSPMLQRLLGKTVRLALALDAKRPVVKADRGLMDQVLMNLLNNGRDAMPDGEG